MASEAVLKKSGVLSTIDNAAKTKSLTHHSSSQRHMSKTNRKSSYGFGSVPGVRPMEKASQMLFDLKRPPMIYFPTYQLDPSLKFHIPSVEKIVNLALDTLFTGHVYHTQRSPGLAIHLATEILQKVKALKFNRYRVITVVTVGQKRAQCYNNAIAFLWDDERDSYVNLHKEETTAFVQVTVFGIYLD